MCHNCELSKQFVFYWILYKSCIFWVFFSWDFILKIIDNPNNIATDYSLDASKEFRNVSQFFLVNRLRYGTYTFYYFFESIRLLVRSRFQFFSFLYAQGWFSCFWVVCWTSQCQFIESLIHYLSYQSRSLLFFRSQ